LMENRNILTGIQVVQRQAPGEGMRRLQSYRRVGGGGEAPIGSPLTRLRDVYIVRDNLKLVSPHEKYRYPGITNFR